MMQRVDTRPARTMVASTRRYYATYINLYLQQPEEYANGRLVFVNEPLGRWDAIACDGGTSQILAAFG